MSQSSDTPNSYLNRSSTRSSLLDVPSMDEPPTRPQNVTHVSTPAYESPLRHHRRQPSTPRQVKETLHARSEYTNSEDDGPAIHRINQYSIKQEVGRGSFGAVHLAVDQFGNEYAVKEFSKSRLRKRAQSSILRRPGARSPAGHLAAGGINTPLHRRSASDIHKDEEAGNPLYLIREEIAVMKKLNHHNLVSLLEVLDDPTEDSLYMVLEMCKKGVVMKVGMHEPAEPYEPERCRTWFRDLILGIEYLHAQGVVHRDIKPDNLLLTEDDVLKIVDFGVSEIFEKDSDFMTTKSAGSPAFLPPELCVTGHGSVSGRAADIWSMGVTLHCLYFGRVPFEKVNPLELYESIRSDDIDLQSVEEEDFKDLLSRLLEKDPNQRIQMPELREHPWVTRRGTDPLLSAEDNTADIVTPPTEEEMKRAITSNLSDLLVVMKAVKRFKNLLSKRRPKVLESILGQQVRMVLPPEPIHPPKPTLHKSQSSNIDERRPIEQALAREGVHRKIDPDKIDKPLTSRDDAAVLGRRVNRPVSPEAHHADVLEGGGPYPSTGAAMHAAEAVHPNSSSEEFLGKGQAHDPLSEDFRFLAVGASATQYPRTPQDSPPIVSESPSAAEDNIYEKAYHEEVERIRSNSTSATVYMTRRVQDTEKYKDDHNMLGIGEDKIVRNFSKLMSKAKDAKRQHLDQNVEDPDEAGLKTLVQGGASSTGLKKLAEAAVKDLKNAQQESQLSQGAGSAGEGFKKLAQATSKDFKALKPEKSSKSDASAADEDGSSHIKATIKDLKSEYKNIRDQKPEKGHSLSELKSAVTDVKQTQINKATLEKKQDQDNGNDLPSLKALTNVVMKDSSSATGSQD